MTSLCFLWAFLKKDFLEELSRRSGILFQAVGIAITCFLYYYLSKMVDTNSAASPLVFERGYFSYFIQGIGIFHFAEIGVGAFVRAFRREATAGMLEALWMSRQSPRLTILAMGVWPFLNSLLYLIGLLTLGSFLSPAMFQGISWGHFSSAMILTFMFYACLGLLAISLDMIIGQAPALINLFGSANLILAGVFFPVSLFPPFLRGASELLPMTHLLRIARGGEALAGSYGAVFLFTGLAFVLSSFCLKVALFSVSKRGVIC